MKFCSLLLSIALTCCCSAAGDHHGNPPADMTMGAAQSGDLIAPRAPDQDQDQDQVQDQVQNQDQDQVQDQDQDQDQVQWRKQVLDLLTQLVQVQTEVAKGQVQVVQLLGSLETQGSQQIQDLQNVARHQSLLVENHQALLLQTSRIATHLQDRKPAGPITAQH